MGVASSSSGGSAVTRRHILVVGILALVCYLPSLAAGFVFDDTTLILNNEYAQSLGYLGRCFQTDLFDTSSRATGQDAAHYYRPLVCVSYALNWALAGPVAWSYHLVNVLAHLAACFLALRVATRWLGDARLGTLAALVFALHPSRSENVVWISGRTDVMMGLFVLAAVELCWLAAERATPGRRLAAYATSALCFGAAVLSKESAVGLPALLLVDWWLARRRGQTSAARHLLGSTVAFGVCGVAYLAVRSVVYPIRPPILDQADMPLGLSAAYVLLTVGYYVERVLVPWPQVFDYKPIVVENGAPVLSFQSVAIGVVALVALVAIAVRAVRRDRDSLGLLAGGFILFLPLSNVSYTGFPGTASDRFLYVPMLVWAATLISLVRPHLERWLGELRLSRLVLAAMTLVCCAITWVRTLDYTTDEAFWRAELAANPTSPRALSGLGRELALRGLREEGFRLIQQAYQPASLRHALIARPTTYYVALLQMHGERLADGNVEALKALSDEMLSLVRMQPREGARHSADLELRTPVDDHLMVSLGNTRVHIAAAGVAVASRLGQRRRALELLEAIPPSSFLSTTALFNVALGLARLGHVEQARQQIALAARRATPEEQSALAGLAARLEQAPPAAASLPNTTPARLSLASQQFDWGNYLLAARTAALAYAEDPEVAAKPLALYLAWCRLDEQALEIARRHMGPEEAERWFAGVAAELSPRTRDALRAPAGDTTWQQPIDD